MWKSLKALCAKLNPWGCRHNTKVKLPKTRKTHLGRSAAECVCIEGHELKVMKRKTHLGKIISLRKQIRELRKELDKVDEHFKPLSFLRGPEMPEDAGKRAFPNMLKEALEDSWKKHNDYRDMGVCAAVAFCFLLTRSLTLLSPAPFLDIILKHRDLFVFHDNRILLKPDLDKCFPRLGGVLGLRMDLFRHFSCWEVTLEKIRRYVEISGNRNDVWFFVHLHPRDQQEGYYPSHAFICVATFTNVSGNTELNGWSYTCYDQENHDQENPRRPLTYMNYASSYCSTWIVTFKRPVPVMPDELPTDTEEEIEDGA